MSGGHGHCPVYCPLACEQVRTSRNMWSQASNIQLFAGVTRGDDRKNCTQGILEFYASVRRFGLDPYLDRRCHSSEAHADLFYYWLRKLPDLGPTHGLQLFTKIALRTIHRLCWFFIPNGFECPPADGTLCFGFYHRKVVLFVGNDKTYTPHRLHRNHDSRSRRR